MTTPINPEHGIDDWETPNTFGHEPAVQENDDSITDESVTQLDGSHESVGHPGNDPDSPMFDRPSKKFKSNLLTADTEGVINPVPDDPSSLESKPFYKKPIALVSIIGGGIAALVIGMGIGSSSGSGTQTVEATPTTTTPFEEEEGVADQPPVEAPVAPPVTGLLPTIPMGHIETVTEVVTEPVLMNAMNVSALYDQFEQNMNCMFGVNPLATQLECYKMVFSDESSGDLNEIYLKGIFEANERRKTDPNYVYHYIGGLDGSNSTIHEDNVPDFNIAKLRAYETQSGLPYEFPRFLTFKGNNVEIDTEAGKELVFGWRLSKTEDDTVNP